MNAAVLPEVSTLLQRAAALRRDGRTAEGDDCVALLLREAALHAPSLAAIGDFCVGAERHVAALAAYDAAVAANPREIAYRYKRAAVCRFLGRTDEAERDYDEVIRVTPDDGESWHSRSGLRVQTPERNHIAELQARVRQGFSDWRHEVPVRYAFAKELEDVGRFEAAWQQFVLGATLRRRHLQYDLATDLATVDWIREAFPVGAAPADDAPVAAPIFIVGMPRNGSTLLERILAGHADVHGAGELSFFAAAVVEAAQHAAGRADLSRAELIAATAGADFGALGDAYLSRVRARLPSHRRFTDKMPLNYLYCGVIQRALPGARILHVTRHPMATCYAIYKTLFAQDYPFSYDLNEIADYYAGYRRLVAHWHDALPDRILDVSYERLVSDVAVETERVLRFCGLDWDPEVLRERGNSWHSTTASASQVRRPVYQSSVDLWRHYSPKLSALAARLESGGVTDLR
jgi:tetratricopeptide (TPR) repeat protein